MFRWAIVARSTSIILQTIAHNVGIRMRASVRYIAQAASTWRVQCKTLLKRWSGLGLFLAALTMIQINEYAIAGLLLLVSGFAFMIQILDSALKRTIKVVAITVVIVIGFFFAGVVLKTKGNKAWSVWLTEKSTLTAEPPTNDADYFGPSVQRIDGGKFCIGSPPEDAEAGPEEKPQREVTVATFYMEEHETTQADWRFIAGLKKFKVAIDLYPSPSPSKDKGDFLPVSNVTWEEAVEFCERLTRFFVEERGKRRRYRLPTEAEWEYACRARPNASCAENEQGIPNLKDVAWYAANAENATHSIKLKQPNPLGLYDMHGNVWEWCSDHAHENYEGVPTDGRSWDEKAKDWRADWRIARGGSWASPPKYLRCAQRGGLPQTVRHVDYGLRVVCEGDCIH